MFKSPHHALQFAFRTMATPIVKMSSINSMRASGDGKGGFGAMTPHDRHAQAAMIMSIVERSVDYYELAYLKARYGKELFGGEHARAVMDVLFKIVVASLPTGVHPRRGVERVIEAYFGKDYGMASLRKELSCNNRRYYEIKESVAVSMESLGNRAGDNAGRAIEAAGLIDIEVTV